MGWAGLYFEFSQAKVLSVCGSFLQRPFSCSIFFKTFNFFFFSGSKVQCYSHSLWRESLPLFSFEAPFRVYQNNKKVGLFMGFSATIFVLILMWCLYCAFGWAKSLDPTHGIHVSICIVVSPCNARMCDWMKREGLWWDLCFWVPGTKICGSKTGFPKFCCGRRKVMLKETGSHLFSRKNMFH